MAAQGGGYHPTVQVLEKRSRNTNGRPWLHVNSRRREKAKKKFKNRIYVGADARTARRDRKYAGVSNKVYG